MTIALLVSLAPALVSGFAHAGAYEDWIMTVYTSSTTPESARQAYASIAQDIVQRRAHAEERARWRSAHAQSRPASAVSAASGYSAAAVAVDFQLRAIYAFPNPAVSGQRPVIHAAVGIADRVTFRVYDISGQLVHEAAMDGTPQVVDDGSGSQYAYEHAWEGHIPSGVYLYTVTAEKNGRAPIKQTGKIAVVR